MGAMCVDAERSEQRRQEREQAEKAQRAGESDYAKLIMEYMAHYGQRANDESRQFIQKNYNDNYLSSTILLTPKTIQNNKASVIDRFQLAIQKKYRCNAINFLEVDYPNRTIVYIWVVDIPNPKNPSKIIQIHYNCRVTFDQQGRFLTGTFEQFQPLAVEPLPKPAGAMSRNKPAKNKQSYDTF